MKATRISRILPLSGCAFLVVMVIGQVYAQDQPQSKKDLRKQERTEKRMAAMDSLYMLVQKHDLVIEANTLYSRTGKPYVVGSDNFISIDGEHFIMQTASPTGIGYNGLGGITVRGRVTELKIYPNTKKNQPITARFEVSTFGLGHGTVYLTINGPEAASAVFSDDWGHRITFSGPPTSVENSTVFQGSSIL